MDLQRMYNVDLTLTNRCNFQCSYCFENFGNTDYNEPDLFISKMIELTESNFFKQNYSILNIGLWGGEPTLNYEVFNYIVNYFGENNRVKFFSFSNGYDLSNIMETLLKFKNYTIGGCHPKIAQQISYDGFPIQQINRTKNGKGTAKEVRNNILNLIKLGVPCTTKSTVTPKTFKFLPECYLDLKEIHSLDSRKVLKCDSYFPTIDYYHIEEYSGDKLELLTSELENSLLEISKEEIEYFKKNRKFFFSWFQDNKRFCSAGKDLVAIDVDSKIYICHSCFYTQDKEDHFICSLKDYDFVKYLEQTNKMHSSHFGKQPKECSECNTTFCLKCNAAKFKNSKKDNYLDKWNDFTSQPKLCFLYKKIGDFSIALRKYIQEEFNNGMHGTYK